MQQMKKASSANRGSSASSTNNTSNIDSKKNKAQTAQISSRNSVERDKDGKKIERATSSKKKASDEMKLLQSTP